MYSVNLDFFNTNYEFILNSFLPNYLSSCLASVDPKWQIQRTKADETCNHKYNGKYEKYNSKNAGYDICKK